MKKSFKLLLLTVLALICALMFTSCGESEPSSENPTSKDDGKTIVLNVFNWGEYISDGFEGSLDSVAEFEDYYFEKFGKKVKVNYSTYATNEDMYSKLTSGAGSYDIVVPSDYMIDRLIEENWLLPFDASTIENYKYISLYQPILYLPIQCIGMAISKRLVQERKTSLTSAANMV